jgi:hypothetical protein
VSTVLRHHREDPPMGQADYGIAANSGRM